MKRVILLITIGLFSSVAFSQVKETEKESTKKQVEKRVEEEMQKELEKLEKEKEKEREKAERIAEEKRKASEAKRREAEKAIEQKKQAEPPMPPSEKEIEEIESAEEAEIPEVPEVPEAPKTPEERAGFPERNEEGVEVKVLGISIKEKGDTTQIKLGKKNIVTAIENENTKVRVFGKEFEEDIEEDIDEKTILSFNASGENRIFGGVEFGFSTFSFGSGFNTDVPKGKEFMDLNVGKSISWSVNFFEMDISIFDEYLKFSTGMGYTVKNFSFSGNDYLQKDSNGVVIGVPSGKELRKNRLRTAYFTVPAIIYGCTSDDPLSTFRFGVGVVGGFRVIETYRTKYFENNHKYKMNVNGGWNTNRFILDGKAIIGYGPLNVYMGYSLIPLFRNNKGPEIYPITFGIGFVPFFD